MIKVLVVDDEDPIRNMLVSILQEWGYSPIGAKDGATALTIAKKENPQVILLDIAMPGMSGIETLHKLRERKQQATIIMMSGIADQDTATKALKMGAHDFVQKPFDLEYLRHVLTVKLSLSG
jgi:DNA-binding response OmpR family regulator